jgi:Ankyrin repeats (3 copies)
MDVLQCVATRENIHFKIRPFDMSLLHVAAAYGHCSCVEFLVDMGIKASVKSGQKMMPLHSCVSYPFTPDRAKIIKLLIANGASLEDKNMSGDTPLHHACSYGCPAMIQFLVVDMSTNLHATNNKDSTPLHVAAEHHKVENACKLLDLGADLNARNNNGLTPVDIAGRRNVTMALSLLTHKFEIDSREKTQLRQENTRLRRDVHDLKNLVMATTFYGNLDHRVDGTTTTNAAATTTTTSRCLAAIQQQQQQQQQSVQKVHHQQG